MLIRHLNINSIQNKFDELKMLNEKLKAHVLIISEMKIDNSYPNSQFIINGYHMYRKDRVKGGGGLIVYFASCIPYHLLMRDEFIRFRNYNLVRSFFEKHMNRVKLGNTRS